MEDSKQVKTKRILVAEDEKALALALKLKLERAGFIVDMTVNGKDLLNAIHNHEYDLLVMDLIMPVLDGFSVLEKLKSEGSTIPIIVTSNLSQKEERGRALKLGARRYLIKSNTPIADIVRHVSEILG